MDNEGWYWPNYDSYHKPRTKRHYFIGLVSLCGKWTMQQIYPDEYSHGIYTGPDNCAECKRLLKKRQEAADAPVR